MGFRVVGGHSGARSVVCVYTPRGAALAMVGFWSGGGYEILKGGFEGIWSVGVSRGEHEFQRMVRVRGELVSGYRSIPKHAWDNGIAERVH